MPAPGERAILFEVRGATREALVGAGLTLVALLACGTPPPARPSPTSHPLEVLEARLLQRSHVWDMRFFVYSDSPATDGGIAFDGSVDLAPSTPFFSARFQQAAGPFRSSIIERREMHLTGASTVEARVLRLVRMGLAADLSDSIAGEPASSEEGAVRALRVRQEEQHLPHLRFDFVSCCSGCDARIEIPNLDDRRLMQRLDFESLVDGRWSPATLWLFEGLPVRRQHTVIVAGDEVPIVEEYHWRWRLLEL